jgi:hypothetical protein
MVFGVQAGGGVMELVGLRHVIWVGVGGDGSPGLPLPLTTALYASSMRREWDNLPLTSHQFLNAR